jgi:predicted Ser/Thr protein kinase/tetratricopeptide (TPR) repeat protein
MPNVTDGLVGKLALQRGWISSEQLKDALAEQSASEREGLRKPLGVILVAKAGLSEERLVELLHEQKRLLEIRAGETAERREDHLFGQILVKRGAATPEQVHQALRVQAERAERGENPVPRLGQILMEMGVSTPPGIQDVLKKQTKALFGCPGCGLRYNIKEVDGGKRYRCRKCGTILTTLPSAGDQRADASAYGLHLEVAEALPPEIAEADLDPANRFDKYVLLEVLGRGGTGTVFRAYQKDLRRVVALKILRGTDEETVQRFAREAQTAARLKHPGIVSVYETGRVEGVWYLAMEYVQGDSLDRVEKPTPRRVAALLRDVAFAVHHAHEHGVLHRDLKPQNILVDAAGKAYVTDFGLARELEGGKSLTMTGMVVGTPAYMSPEQARGDRGLDGRSDVCGLGAVLYEMLAGRLPYNGLTAVDTALAVINQEPVAPRRLIKSVPPDLEAICLKAMEKDRERRYATARELGEDLQRFSEGEPVRAVPPSILTRALMRVRRHRLKAAAAGTGALTALIVLILLFTLHGESREARALREAATLENAGDLAGALDIYRRYPAADADVRRLEGARERKAEDDRRSRAEILLAEAAPSLAPEARAAIATKALGIFPDLEAAFVVRAAARREAGHDAAAYEDLGRAAERSAGPLRHWMARAELARRLGRLEDEVLDLTRALSASPQSGDLRGLRAAAHVRAARALLEKGDDDRRAARHVLAAEADFAEAGPGARSPLEEVDALLASASPDIRRALATAFAEEALAACPAAAAVRRAGARAASCDLSCAPALAARALGSLLEERPTEALADASRALELLPNLPEALAIGGLAKARLGVRGADPGLAADGCRDVDLFLEHAPPKPSLRPLRAAAEALKLDVPPEARAALSREIAARGLALRERGDAAGAGRILSRAIEVDGDNAVARAARGELRFTAGQFAAAAEDWTKAGALDAGLRERFQERLNDARRRTAP